MFSRWRAVFSITALLTALVAAPAQAAPTAVMVLYFDNDTGNAEYDSLAKGLADMMITDLAAIPSLRVVEREKLEALLGELKLQRKKYFDPRTAQRIGKGTGAAYAVTGSFASIEPNIRLDVRLIKIDDGVVVKSASVSGRKDKFFDLQQQLTAKLTDGLSGVLGEGDAALAGQSSRDNKMDSLGGLLDYGKGLDARDRGDLDAASKQLQKVVASNPNFKLGKERYLQIMKALYAAKDVRNAQLGGDERVLLDHISAELAKGKAGTSARALSYRVLMGQYHLTKLAEAVKENKPSTVYAGHLRAYVDSQLKLISETRHMEESRYSNRSMSDEDIKLAEVLNIKQPGSTFAASSPGEVASQLGELLIENEASIHLVRLHGREIPCFYKLDSTYPKLVAQVYEQALQFHEKSTSQYRVREIMRVLRDYGRALALLGQLDQAAAKLQSGLDRFPKSDEFSRVEDQLREILKNDVSPHCK